MLSNKPLYSPHNRCHLCGATNYRRVLARDTAGAMRPTSDILCSGCQRQYPSVQAWRGIPHPNLDAPTPGLRG